MTTLNIYSKEQTDTLLANKADVSALPAASQLVPSTSGASSGDVLTFDGSTIGWATGGGSGGMTLHTYSSYSDLVNDLINHPTAIVALIQPLTETRTNYTYASRVSVDSSGTVNLSFIYYAGGSVGGYPSNINLDVGSISTDTTSLVMKRTIITLLSTMSTSTRDANVTINDFGVLY